MRYEEQCSDDGTTDSRKARKRPRKGVHKLRRPVMVVATGGRVRVRVSARVSARVSPCKRMKQYGA
eukprot:11252796-Alexandrium_andersonii.AAC.1